MIDRDFVVFNKDYPLVVIGDAVTDYKRYYDGVIITLQSISDLREKIAYYSSVSNIGRVLVLEDISFLGTEATAALLKFIEETTIPVVLLSRYDKLDRVLLSRIRRVVKYYKEPTGSKFMSPSLGHQQMQDTLSSDSHYYDVVRYMGKLSPKLLMIDKAVKVVRIKNKIFSFM
jgi:hypothetical protein